MKKKALITGITGQDGALLAQHLLHGDLYDNYHIIAPTRNNPDKSRLSVLNVDQDLIDFVCYERWTDFHDIIEKYQPDEIYHLAAMSHVGQSHHYPEKVFDVNVMWTLEILNAVAQLCPSAKVFFASSCEIFKSDIGEPVYESSVKQPSNPYGISKSSAHDMVQYYRNVKNIFACNGILFNHESEIRDPSFVSKKICREVARIVKHGGEPLYLGNIAAKKDWGYAPDYVAFFQSILQQQDPDDYILATGVLHSVQDMVNCAFAALDYDITWSGEGLNTKATNADGHTVVAIDEQFFRPLDDRFLVGDASHAQKNLNFNNLTPFADWVKRMTLNEYGQ